ncbi:carbohydrate kinase family protein [Paenibacillus sacheonensis]|uniref:Carbohydrate kinase family protein n=1 Tax=Paenibacillus sacheonensis TaxID=742054 RepID=A0A7X4YQ23_9BACL|nr:carbohydrate kinase family protein [Paenibacillus sacheonensis]MBM7566180.1 sugar/nucleoside kinase (ribokinase family) [Paenibacillus sacheonensis]NBC70388.1 carbohydrate kinase family protein [Paenibacillus sacheonensis]
MTLTGKEAEAACDVMVCGHISIDVIPRFRTGSDSSADPHESGAARLTPGGLIETDAAEFSTGGAVSNTGIALHKLGAKVRLVGKVSDDFFGSLTLRLLSEIHPAFAESIAQAAGETSSYTIVVNPPGTDRIFLHCPGTNDTFAGQDIDWERSAGTRHFHFGYPPLMKGMYADGGERLAGILRAARQQGMTVSLDMAMPGRGTAAYAADWTGILSRALPFVDIFMPSLEEMLMMIGRESYEHLAGGSDDLCENVSTETIRELAERLLAMGCGMVVLKLGAAGLYLRSSERFCGIGEEWRSRELWSPCFRTRVEGTTGAGDCTIAGFLKGFLLALGPEETMTAAVAVGAFSVEQLGATGGIPSWEKVQARIDSGWDRLPTKRQLPDWRWLERAGVWAGPADPIGADSDE